MQFRKEQDRHTETLRNDACGQQQWEAEQGGGMREGKQRDTTKSRVRSSPLLPCISNCGLQRSPLGILLKGNSGSPDPVEQKILFLTVNFQVQLLVLT